ncbi:MAG: DMT family transporter [Acidobacteriota bacterium]
MNTDFFRKPPAPLPPPPPSIDPGMLIVVLIWGINFVVVKSAFAEMPPLAFTALRFVITSATFALLLISRGQMKTLPEGTLWRVIWLGLVGNTLYQGLFALGLSMTTAANSSMLLTTTPALLALVGGLLGIEQVTRRMWVGIALATTGIALVMTARGASLSVSTLRGDLLTLASVLCWVAYALGVRTVSRQISSLQLTAMSMLAGTPGLVLLGAPGLLQVKWTEISVAAWLGLAYSALLSLVVAYLLYNRSIRRIGSVGTSIYGSAIPVITALLAWPILGERPTLLQGMGAALIIAGVLAARQREAVTADETASAAA